MNSQAWLRAPSAGLAPAAAARVSKRAIAARSYKTVSLGRFSGRRPVGFRPVHIQTDPGMRVVDSGPYPCLARGVSAGTSNTF
jgi:hypothetical protein